MEDVKTISPTPDAKQLTLEETGFVAYYNNEGKGRPCVNLPLIFSLLICPARSVYLQTSVWIGSSKITASRVN